MYQQHRAIKGRLERLIGDVDVDGNSLLSAAQNEHQRCCSLWDT
jgi:hypothetical protein